MTIRNKSLQADLLILLSALLWGGEYVVVKDMVEYLPPNWINAFRFLAASVVMLPFITKKLRTVGRVELLAGSVLGVFLFGGFTFQTIGIQYTTAAKSGFITSTYVVIVPFVYWLLRKHFPGVKAILAGVVCAGGIGLISLEGSGAGVNKGDLLTLFASLCFTGSVICLDIYSKRHDAVILTFLEMIVGGFLALIAALLFEPFPTGVIWGGSEIFQLVYIVLLGSLFCHLASNVAMRWTVSSHAAILWSMESVFALVLSIIFLGEILTLQMGLGFALVFAAVVVSESG